MKLKPNKLLVGLVLTVGMNASINAQSYPFPLPETVSGAINIKTDSKVKHNNLQLGLNLEGFKLTEDRDNFKKLNPILNRFPHGLFANWYDWTTDKTRVFGDPRYTTVENGVPRTLNITVLETIQTMENGGATVGLNEFETLRDEQADKFETVWTMNMSADGTDYTKSEQTIPRYNDLIRRGFPVKYVEMGNENFYAGQRSSIMPNVENYISRAKRMHADLKTASRALNKNFPGVPVVRTAVPMSHSGKGSANWNRDLYKSDWFYDAVIVHSYVGTDPDAGTIDPNASPGEAGLGSALVARKGLAESFDGAGNVHDPSLRDPGKAPKPIWLTEWGVSSNGPNAVSALGSADCYMYLAENPTKVELATWFTATRSLNGFSPESINEKGKKVFDRTKKTSYGSMFEIVRGFYENAEIFSNSIKSSSVNLTDGVKAIPSIAVIQNGKIKIMALNLTNKDDVLFQIKINGVNYTKGFTHKAFKFAGVKQIDEKTLPIDADPLSLIQNGTGSIARLPRLSINVIELSATTAKDGIGLNEKIIIGEDEQSPSIKVFPNPVKDLFTIALNGITNSEVIITDLLGKVVYQTKTNQKSIQIEKGTKFVLGIYMVKVIGEDGNTYENKIIFQ